jgi:hypothetical protein
MDSMQPGVLGMFAWDGQGCGVQWNLIDLHQCKCRVGWKGGSTRLDPQLLEAKGPKAQPQLPFKTPDVETPKK